MTRCYVQWGYVSNTYTVVFNIAFSTACYGVTGTPDASTTKATLTVANTLTTTGANIILHGYTGWWLAYGK